MQKPIVLVIHGMGTHKPGTTREAVYKGLNETAGHLGFQNYKVQEKVELIEFNYSKFLDEIRLRDAENAQKIVGHLQLLQGRGLGERITGQLTEFFAELDQDKMFNTHWMDVIYYGLMFWGEKIRVDLAAEIGRLLKEKDLKNRKFHIIGHSLGCAILHDTLAKLFRKDTDVTDAVRASAPAFDVDLFRVDSVLMMANVSRMLNVLNDIADPLNSIVTSDTPGCTDLMYNARNEFDPFTWFKRYDRPITMGKQYAIKTIRKFDTHDLQEYMAAPETTKLFLLNILNEELTQEQYDKAVIEHGKTSVNAKYEDLKEAFKELQRQPDLSGKAEAVQQLFKSWKAFEKILKQILDQA